MLIKHSNIRAVAMNKLCGEESLISTRRRRIQRRRCDQYAVARCYFVFVLHRSKSNRIHGRCIRFQGFRVRILYVPT